MRLALALALLFPLAACAQTADKPSAVADPGQRRADSVVVRPCAPGSAECEGARAGALGGGLSGVVPDTLALRVGETALRLIVHEASGPEPALDALVVHDNENTAVEAALDILAARGGRLVELSHTGERNVAFRAAGRAYAADPNRIFTDAGRRATLAALSRDTPAARAALASFAEAMLAAYAPEPPAVVVALHNNTDGGYSARSYAPGAEYARDAAALHLEPGADPDDFFFVTTRPLYDGLVARGFNVVLQDNDRATDDGSLSVWAAQQGVPYVNVEAKHGSRAEQVRMIGALLDALAGAERSGPERP